MQHPALARQLRPISTAHSVVLLAVASLTASTFASEPVPATSSQVPNPRQSDLGIGTHRVVIPGPNDRLAPIVTLPSPPIFTPSPSPRPEYPYPGFPTFPSEPGGPRIIIVPVQNGPYIINHGWGYCSPGGAYPWPYFYAPRLGYFASDGYNVFDRRRDRQRVNINVNSGGTLLVQSGALKGPDAFGNYVNWTHPLWGAMDSFGTYYGWTRNNSSTPSSLTPNTAAPTAAPSAATAPAKDLSDLDRGLWFLQRGLHNEAVSAFRAHIKSSDADARGWRWLGFTLLAQRRFDDGTAIIRRAYTLDHKLADEPLDFAISGMNANQARDLTNRAVIHAHASKSASAWLTVASLMQAQGRPDTARQMLERARTAGLDLDTYEPFAAAVR